ncbi:MAG: hypothetical protein LBV69_08705 [Bacteroidales bacterium]|jgi:hypothetical protein|nr:hypothetical protein [Bacteroidales bacterium]
MKKILLFIFSLFFLNLSIVFSQQEESNFAYNVGLDFQTRYIWRGQALGGSAPSLQPGMGISWKGLSFGVWGAYSLSRNVTQELDLSLSYTFWEDRFTVGIIDYSFPQEINQDYNYFDYKQNGSHVLEAGLTYNGEKNVPVYFSIFTNFYGADTKKSIQKDDNTFELNDDGTVKQKNIFSTYIELGYNLPWKKLGVEFNIFAGCALNSYKLDVPDLDINGLPVWITEKQTGFYNNKGFACVNVGITASKTFEVGKLSIPLSGGLIFNPNDKKAYFMASFGIHL